MLAQVFQTPEDCEKIHALLPLRQMSTVGSEMILHVMHFSAL